MAHEVPREGGRPTISSYFMGSSTTSTETTRIHLRQEQHTPTTALFPHYKISRWWGTDVAVCPPIGAPDGGAHGREVHNLSISLRSANAGWQGAPWHGYCYLV